MGDFCALVSSSDLPQAEDSPRRTLAMADRERWRDRQRERERERERERQFSGLKPLSLESSMSLVRTGIKARPLSQNSYPLEEQCRITRSRHESKPVNRFLRVWARHGSETCFDGCLYFGVALTKMRLGCWNKWNMVEYNFWCPI